MTINFIRDGQNIIPDHTHVLRRYGNEHQLNLTLEWMNGQYWLHSDLQEEKPISIFPDEELSRHVDYFKRSSLHKEVLARAIGIKGALRPRVLDLTAGLLGDSFLFLAMGCEVIAVERHPVIAFLIQSALENAHHPLLKHLTFRPQEAREALNDLSEVDVIFYDPMFEDPNSKATPRKEMRIFRSLLGEDKDISEVVALALRARARRLVVKRPRLSVPVVPGNPVQYIGKATRYDVYLPQNHGPSESNQIK